ncbi:MAG: lamin tail domain-containing protein [Caldilineaceae bacterium]
MHPAFRCFLRLHAVRTRLFALLYAILLLSVLSSLSWVTTGQNASPALAQAEATNEPLLTATLPVTTTDTLASMVVLTATATATALPTDTPPPADTATPTATLTPLPTNTPPATDTAPPPPTDTASASPTDTPTLAPSLPVRVLITEVMADPKAVSDANGEWFELYNPNAEAVNLRGWTIKDLGNDQHPINAHLILQPGAFVVLGRNNDSATNGGVTVAYMYTGVNLANTSDALLLIAPDGTEVDRVVWGGASGLKVTAGASMERANLADPAVWTTAQTSWSGSAGDNGSPGAMTAMPVTVTPTTVTTATPTVQTTPGAPAHILISEFLADPKAVSDSNGEWIELYNTGSDAVNLRGWTLADLGSDQHVIQADVVIAPGQYLVLGRNGDSPSNGGVTVDYVYTGMNLANQQDEIILRAPDGSEADRVVWGGDSALKVKAGASLQRTTWESPPTWETSQTPWPGSAGDAGTPHTSYVAPPGGTVTPTPPSVNGWVPVTTTSVLQIEEVAYQGDDEEYIALLNTGDTPLDLSGWSVGDAEAPDGNEGMFALPDGYQLQPGALFVIARNGATFHTTWGRAADAEFEEQAADTLTLAKRRNLATGSLALNDSGDEVVLLNPAGQLADAVAFTGGNYQALGLTGELRPPKGDSLQRIPGATFPAVREVRHRFLYAPPSPFDMQTLPVDDGHPNPELADGLVAVWGSLGAHSNFSAGYTAPPHYLLAAAGAQGLDFLAIADDAPVAPIINPNATFYAPAWTWKDTSGNQAVIYSNQRQSIDRVDDLLAYLAESGKVAQWQGKNALPSTGMAAFAADDSGAPGDLTVLYKRWSSTAAVLLPAGNANPALPGAVDAAPRYTGLAVKTKDANGVLQALADQRGWLTNAPGLWVTLQAQLASGERRWMGATLPPGNQITLQIAYGDRNGQPAGLALWQDDQPVRQLDTSSVNGQWSVTVPAVPDSLLYVVATQADGDFAVTAPLRVSSSNNGSVLLNEVLPAPVTDLNNDHKVDNNDEFIELYNPSDQPVALADWQLSDATGDQSPSRRFTFGPGRYINGGEHLLLWRTESHINLNNSQDHVRLLNPQGDEVDRIAWEKSPAHGLSISRVPDGKTWQIGTKVTPGKPNALAGSGDDNGAPAPTPSSDHHDKNLPPPAPTLEPNYGQAGGPPASIAQAKLAGLEAWVEFRAVVITPPGLFNASIYVADPAPDENGPYAGIGVNLFLRKGEFPPLQEGDRVRVRGKLQSFRGEMELQMDSPDQLWRISAGLPLQPLPIAVTEVGETFEGRLVTFTGVVSGFQGDSIFLNDPNHPESEPVRVTVRSSLGWKRPFVKKGQQFRVVGVVSQLARAAPWNDGYRVLVRYQRDLTKLTN